MVITIPSTTYTGSQTLGPYTVPAGSYNCTFTINSSTFLSPTQTVDLKLETSTDGATWTGLWELTAQGSATPVPKSGSTIPTLTGKFTFAVTTQLHILLSFGGAVTCSINGTIT